MESTKKRLKEMCASENLSEKNHAEKEKVNELKVIFASKFLDPLSPSSSSSTLDATFEPTIDMMVNDFDDEQTLNEEEELAALEERRDPQEEIDYLIKESEIPLEQLLAKYGAVQNPPTVVKIKKHTKVKIKSLHTVDQNQKNTKELADGEEHEIDSNETIGCKENVINGEDVDHDNSPAGFANSCDYMNEVLEAEKNALGHSHLLDIYQEESLVDDGESIGALYDDDDEDDINEYFARKTIMVGDAYQAVIPVGLSQYGDILPYENEDKLIWEPSQVAENEVEKYLLKTRNIKQSIPSAEPLNIGHHNEQTKTGVHCKTIKKSMHNDREHIIAYEPEAESHLTVLHACSVIKDNEQALHLLVQCGYDFKEALRRKRLNAVPTLSMSIWSEDECNKFEEGIQKFGKDFLKIRQSQVRTRTMRELVQFYYLWKKSERRDQCFANSDTVDHMDIYLNEGKDYSPHGNTIPSMLGAIASTTSTMMTRKISSCLPKNFSIMTGGNAGLTSNSLQTPTSVKTTRKRPLAVPTKSLTANKNILPSAS